MMGQYNKLFTSKQDILNYDESKNTNENYKGLDYNRIKKVSQYYKLNIDR